MNLGLEKCKLIPFLPTFAQQLSAPQYFICWKLRRPHLQNTTKSHLLYNVQALTAVEDASLKYTNSLLLYKHWQLRRLHLFNTIILPIIRQFSLIVQALTALEDASLKYTQIIYRTRTDRCGGRIFNIHRFSLIVQTLTAVEDASLKYTNTPLLYKHRQMWRPHL
jgi:type III secretory pathway component EscS